MGAFQPFFRAHAELTTKRREPWLFGEPHTGLIKAAIEKRYKLLPYIYTLFQESSKIGSPIARSMMQEFPSDEATFDMDDQFMLGSALVVKPVSEAGLAQVKTYLPAGNVWYDYESFEIVNIDLKTRLATMKTPMHVMPVYLRGGSIIPKKERLHRSSQAMKLDPFTLLVALDDGKARGNLYVDDGHSFEHVKGHYLNIEYEFKDFVLSSKLVNLKGNKMDSKDKKFNTRIERIVILGLDKLNNLKVVSGTKQVEHFISNGILTLKNPNFLVGQDWQLKFTN